jgi:subtilisin family serine protease
MPATRVLAALGLALAAFPLAPAAAAPAAPTAVVAVVDTGIDPYHAAFRDRSPRAQRYPGTYLPGYPKNAVALRLTLDAKDYWSAVRRDCERVWSKVRPGQLYWFPGTKIVGAVSFDLTKTGADCDADEPRGMPVLDDHWHGTMTASRAAGARHGACPACRVVSVQFQTGYGIANATDATTSAVSAVSWAGRNSTWIDAQSNSWGPLPAYDATGAGGLFFDSRETVRAAEESAQRHLAFWSSGNGAGGIGGALGMPTVLNPHMTPSVIRVGGHDSGYVTTWPGWTPHVVADACDSWAAQAMTTSGYGERVGGGTSAAAPYAAGGAAAALIEARRLTGDVRTGVRGGAVARGRRTRTGPLADGVLTLAEWREVALKTASPRPVEQPEDGPSCLGADPLYGPLPVRWADVPAGAPEHVLIGYGALDRRAVALAKRVLAGGAALPDRAAADTYFAADRQAREAQHQVYRGQ